MEKFNVNQIEQFLQIEKEVIGSADHHELANNENVFGDDVDTVSGITITTTLAITGV